MVVLPLKPGHSVGHLWLCCGPSSVSPPHLAEGCFFLVLLFSKKKAVVFSKRGVADVSTDGRNQTCLTSLPSLQGGLSILGTTKQHCFDRVTEINEEGT